MLVYSLIPAVFRLFIACYLLISCHNFAVKWCQSWCQIGVDLSYPYLTLKSRKACHFLFLGCLVVDIHCGLDVSMTHNFLNNFDVSFVLAEACAKSVSQVMCAKVWQQNRFTSFFLCRLGFFNITVTDNSCNCSIDNMGVKHLPIPV